LFSFFTFSFLLSLSFSPFSVLLSLLRSPSFYTWKAVVTYRWRNPQLWFPKGKSCSLSLSPFSFPFNSLLSPVSVLLSLLLFLSQDTWNAVVTYRWRNPHPVACPCLFFISPFPPPFTVPFPFSFSLLLFLVPSPFSFPHSPFLLSPFSFSFPSFFPFLVSPYFSPFSLLLTLSLYTWNAAVFYSVDGAIHSHGPTKKNHVPCRLHWLFSLPPTSRHCAFRIRPLVY